MQSRLPGFHAFRFLNLPHMQNVQELVSVRFRFLSLHQHWNGHRSFQERVGWHSPRAQVPDVAFREVVAHFPRDDPTEFCFFYAIVLIFFVFVYFVFCHCSSFIF